jgi:hypothetical protein
LPDRQPIDLDREPGAVAPTLSHLALVVGDQSLDRLGHGRIAARQLDRKIIV